MVKTGFRGERKGNPHPVPLPRIGGMYGRKIKRNLLLAHSMRGNVTSHLFGKPPNLRRGTSCKRRQTSAFTHTLLSWGTYPAIAGYFQREKLVKDRNTSYELALAGR